MPKLRAMFSSVFEPFCWPTTTTARPSSSAMPPTTAGSSRNSRSPCSSWNLSKTPAMTSSACGRFGSRASWTACHAVPRVAAISAASVMSAGSARWPFVSTGAFFPKMRSTMDIPTNSACRRRGSMQRFRAVARSRRSRAALQAPLRVVRRGPERVEEEREPLAEQRPRHDLVDEAVREHELRALEPLRQLLADGLVGHARPGEADERVGLGEDEVPERRVRREDPAGGRIGEDAHERHAGVGETSESADDLGHLHEREGPLLHARPAGRGDDDERAPFSESALRDPGDLLADDAAHRAADEREVHRSDRRRDVADAREPGDDRIPLARLRPRGSDARRVRAGVGEREGVAGGHLDVVLVERALVDEELDALARADPEVVAALGADAQVLDELLVDQHVAAARTLRPKVRREVLPPSCEGHPQAHY